MKAKNTGSNGIKGVVAGVSLLAAFIWVSHWVGATPQVAEFLGAHQYVVAGEDGIARFASTDEPTQYLVIGFDSAPVVLDVSDEWSPRSVVCEQLSTSQDKGALLVIDAAGVYVAEGLNEVPPIQSIGK